MKYTDKIYGEFNLTGVIEDIIHTQIFQRLNHIHQGGAIFLLNPKMNQTRFEHSVGVMLLIKMLGGSLEEQIAGLIHDISHTAFSHLVDYVFEVEEEDYHEKRFEEVIRVPELVEVLDCYGLSVNSFLDLEQYKMLEYPLPYLSADRIDYTLRDLFQIGEISLEEIHWFLNGLLVYENRIVLKSTEYGVWFQRKYHWLVTNYFGGEENRLANIIMKKIILECLEMEVIQEADFWEDDFFLMKKIDRIIDLEKRIEELKQKGLKTHEIKMKKRMINPEILMGNQPIPLSELGKIKNHKRHKKGGGM